MRPQRIQLRRSKGWRIPEGVVIVDRRTRWGNPYRVTHCDAVHVPYRHWHVFQVPHIWLSSWATKACAVDDAVERFVRAIEAGYGFVPWPREIREALAGRDLACWCPLPVLGEPDICHAAVLIDIANAGTAQGGKPA